MFTEIIEYERIDFEKRVCRVKYIRIRNLHNLIYYTSELEISEKDWDPVIMDELSLKRLKKKIELLLPSIIYSRMIYESLMKKRSIGGGGLKNYNIILLIQRWLRFLPCIQGVVFLCFLM